MMLLPKSMLAACQGLFIPSGGKTNPSYSMLRANYLFEWGLLKQNDARTKQRARYVIIYNFRLWPLKARLGGVPRTTFNNTV